MTAEAGPSHTTSLQSEYDIPKPSRINLKETRSDRASRLYEKERKRHHRQQERISRANGYAVSPPPAKRSRDGTESMTPPRFGNKGKNKDTSTGGKDQPVDMTGEDDDEEGGSSGIGGGYRFMGGHGARAVEELRLREEREKMEWLAQEELEGGDYRASGGYRVGGGMDVRFEGFIRHTTGLHHQYHHQQHHTSPISRIPKRHLTSAGIGLGGPLRRDFGFEEFGFDTGVVPELGNLSNEEYSAWMRTSMNRLLNRKEVESREKAQRERDEKERLKVEEKARAMKEEERRMARIRAEKSAAVEDARKAERIRYRTRWKSIGEVGGEIEEANLAFQDVPWPVYRPTRGKITLDTLEVDGIKAFLLAIAGDDGAKDGGKAVFRESIRSFHPDKFYGKLLGRVREEDRDMVKQGVEVCSRVINGLSGELKG